MYTYISFCGPFTREQVSSKTSSRDHLSVGNKETIHTSD